MAGGQQRDAQKKGSGVAARHAEQPGQAVNVDLCFVPWVHGAETRLPAVSGSSGHLIIEPAARERASRSWPGQVFQQADLSYEQAMRQYRQDTRDRLLRGKNAPRLPEEEPTTWRKEMAGRMARHVVREHRRQEDVAWLAERVAYHQLVEHHRRLTPRQRAAQAAAWQAQKRHWAEREQARKACLDRRSSENQVWHQRIQQRKHTQPQVWIALLVITDNATRQCLGLPIFASGANVTAQEVVSALHTLLPNDLAFLISDQGTHFRAKLFAQLAQSAGFVHVPIYRHRPQTNGIAERFVRTLKLALRPLAWSGPDQLANLLAEVRPAYNERPHQGLAIPGLSPHEFANCIWLL